MSTYRSTRAFGAEQIRAFLQSVDRHLSRPVRLEVIGGSAAALAHGATSTTVDVDTFNAIDAELEQAVARAVAETGFDIPICRAAVADVPYNYEDRLERHLSDLIHLEVWVLEKHDLVLSKTVRGFEHDLQQIREIHDRAALSFEILVERFGSEMDHAVGDPSRLRSNFLMMIADVFGELKRVAAEKLMRIRG